MHFTRALCRLPGANFADGLTQFEGGRPDFARTLEQHARYVDALRECGLAVEVLPADPAYPDGTFVEDTAVLAPGWAVLTIPGAPTRAGEVCSIEAALRRDFPDPGHITAPGTVDGGDICEAGTHYFLGVSHRTNAEGARQLAALLAAQGITSSVIDIRASRTLLHLKTGLSWLGEDLLAVMSDVPEVPELSRYRRIVLEPGEEYAANCVRVNDRVLVARGFPRFVARLREEGLDPLELDMSEFRKMDGGLSCLSLRF